MDRMPIRNMRRIYRAISDICRIMQLSALMRICKYIRTAIPNQNTLLIRHSWWPSRGMIIIVTAKYLHMYMDGRFFSPHFWKLILQELSDGFSGEHQPEQQQTKNGTLLRLWIWSYCTEIQNCDLHRACMCVLKLKLTYFDFGTRQCQWLSDKVTYWAVHRLCLDSYEM